VSNSEINCLGFINRQSKYYWKSYESSIPKEKNLQTKPEIFTVESVTTVEPGIIWQDSNEKESATA
jgi:hypothetical protein